MQCVILAAGEGTRMRPLTETKPKPLIEVCGKSILQHIVEALPSVIDEIILVVSYKEDMIRAYCGGDFLGKKVTCVVQKNPKGGTGDALMQTKGIAKGKFLVMYGDDIHGKEALEEVVTKDSGMLTIESDTPERFGVLDLNEDGTLRSIIEKPENPPSNFVNIGGFVVTEDIFTHVPGVSHLGEALLTDMVTDYAKTHRVEVVRQSLWLPLGRPEDIPKAEAVLCPTN